MGKSHFVGKKSQYDIMQFMPSTSNQKLFSNILIIMPTVHTRFIQPTKTSHYH